MITLKTDSGIYLDTPSDLQVALEYNNPVFGNLDQLTKSYSYPFKLPVTPTNQAFFKFAEKFHTQIEASTEEEIEILYFGAPLQRGTLQVDKVSREQYEVHVNIDKKIDWFNKPIADGLADLSGVTLTTQNVEFFGVQDSTNYTHPFFNLMDVLNIPAKKNKWEVINNGDTRFNEIYLFNHINSANNVFSLPNLTFLEFLSDITKGFNLRPVFDYVRKEIRLEDNTIELTDLKKYEYTGEFIKSKSPFSGLRLEYSQLDDYLRPPTAAPFQPFLLGEAKSTVTMEGYPMRSYTVGGNLVLEYYHGLDDTGHNDRVQFIFWESASQYGDTHSTGLDFYPDRLLPEFWQTYIELISDSYFYNTVLLMDLVELQNFDITKPIHLEGKNFMITQAKTTLSNTRQKKIPVKVKLLDLV